MRQDWPVFVATCIVLVLGILLFIGGGCPHEKPHEVRQRVAYEVTFQSGRVDTLFADEWTGIMYDSLGRRVRVDHWETSKRLY